MRACLREKVGREVIAAGLFGWEDRRAVMESRNSYTVVSRDTFKAEYEL